MFRRAQLVMTVAQKPETFYMLEVAPKQFINTNRLCDSLEDAVRVQNETGHGEQKTKLVTITFAERYIRMMADPGTFQMFDEPLT